MQRTVAQWASIEPTIVTPQILNIEHLAFPFAVICQETRLSWQKRFLLPALTPSVIASIVPKALDLLAKRIRMPFSDALAAISPAELRAYVDREIAPSTACAPAT
jgi:hypothetical protein